MTDDNGKRIVEIHGTKFEVDLREAHKVEKLRVGDRVSVLTKDYAKTYKVNHGVVVGFEPFAELPTVVISYITSGWDAGKIEILAFNEKTEDVEIVKSTDDVLFDKAEAVEGLDKRIEKARAELAEEERKKAYFLRHFGRYWREAENVELTRHAVLGEDY